VDSSASVDTTALTALTVSVAGRVPCHSCNCYSLALVFITFTIIFLSKDCSVKSKKAVFFSLNSVCYIYIEVPM
jgi:hypothetical protein